MTSSKIKRFRLFQIYQIIHEKYEEYLLLYQIICLTRVGHQNYIRENSREKGSPRRGLGTRTKSVLTVDGGKEGDL